MLSSPVEYQEGEQLLSYDPKHDVWYALTLWMSDETFCRYVAPWLEGITQPTQEQLLYAVGRCRRVSYWMRCGDPDVHFGALPVLRPWPRLDQPRST